MALNSKESKIYQMAIQHFKYVDDPFEREVSDYVNEISVDWLNEKQIDNVKNYLKVVFEGKAYLNFHSI